MGKALRPGHDASALVWLRMLESAIELCKLLLSRGLRKDLGTRACKVLTSQSPGTWALTHRIHRNRNGEAVPLQTLDRLRAPKRQMHRKRHRDCFINLDLTN